MYKAECIFCQKTSKYLKGNKTRESITQCSELRADFRVRDAAVKKMDNRMLALLSRKLVAAEGHYHGYCYRLYTKEECRASSGADTEQEDAETRYDTAVEQAYNELFSFIRNEVFANPQVLPMTDLTARLVTCLYSLGVVKARDSTKKHIRRKLESEFGEALHISPQRQRKTSCIS